jgi:CRP-like cAMP-binding protein
MMMGKNAVTRGVRVGAGALPSDVAPDLDAKKRRILKRNAIANGASADSQSTLAEAGSLHRIARGRPLVSQGEPISSVAIVGSGRLRMIRMIDDGRALSLGYRGPGDIIGEAALGGTMEHRESAIAAEEVEALVIPLATARTVMATDLAFATGVMATLVARHYDAEERLASMLFRNVEARLAEFLLKAATRWGIPDPRGVLIAAPLTHQEMASMIGSTRETVTLTLGDLRRKGIIEFDRRRVVVRDRDSLRTRV